MQNIPPCMIYIDKDGKWFYNGAEMINRAIVLDFYSHLTIDDSGIYIIKRGNETCFVEVADTPFIVTRVDFEKMEGVERVHLFLIDETEETLAPETLIIGNENILYCTIKQGLFMARFSRAAYYQLASRIKEEGDKYYLPLNNKKYLICDHPEIG
ncbi:MAG: DUF1285 domain-containing protein [Deltaproteobacteria bacterium]|nr:DUF1285 domain-containing protein [Deltaproteobacteria bacterium]